jgi:5-methylcytosine-specific restriction endonuclease McrA
MAEGKRYPSDWHVLSGIDPEARTATCSICGPVRVVYKRHRDQYRCITPVRAQRRKQREAARKRIPRTPPKPRSPAQRQRDAERWSYRHIKGDRCEKCGWVPVHPCQLEIDHIVPRSAGGTNHRDNLQTLCANCHRLKTHLEKVPRPPSVVS